MIIDSKNWHICKICGEKIKNINKKHGGSGKYSTQSFIKHIEIDHNKDLEYYFFNICDIKKQKCPCGICNKDLNIISKGKDFLIRKMACGRNNGLLKWSEEAKTSRLGAGNPMFLKKPWNKNLNKHNNHSIMLVSEKMSGRKISEESKKRMSISAKKRQIHGHTGHKHTEKMKEEARQRTLKMIKDGVFKQTKSKPHIIMKCLLDKININYIEEHIINCWCFDFYLPDYNIVLEVDGDYFHSNPKIYPKGPKTKTQKINWYRDIKKNNFCKENKIVIYRFWECDLLNNIETIEEKICSLKK